MAAGVTATTSSNTPAAPSSASPASNKQAQMGQGDFLKLLVTQLKFQDPMKPMEDKEFIAQMAQMNTLDEMKIMNKHMAAQSDFAMLSEASSLIGKQVTVNTNGETFPGKVVEIRRISGDLKVMVQKKATPDGKQPDPQPVTMPEIQKVSS